MNRISIFITLGLLQLFWVQLNAQNNATVIRVVDGDTYQVLKGKRIFTIRLLNVDAPETKQPFGEAAKDSVSKIILGKSIEFENIKLDKYNRTLATVYINKKRLDSILIAKGWAWFYEEYSNKIELKTLQNVAMNKRLGLWKCGFSKACPPSVYRKLNAKNRAKYCKGCNN